MTTEPPKLDTFDVLARELKQRWNWKGRLTVGEVKLWAVALGDVPEEKLVTALVKWRNGDKGHFPPKLAEICSILKIDRSKPRPLEVGPASGGRYGSTVATQFARQRIEHNGKPEAAVLMLAYRSLWHRAREVYAGAAVFQDRDYRDDERARLATAAARNSRELCNELIACGLMTTLADRLTGERDPVGVAGKAVEAYAAAASSDENAFIAALHAVSEAAP